MLNTLTIARFTIQEAINRRLLHAALVLSAAFVGLFGLAFWLLYSKALELAAFRPGSAPGLVFAGAVQTVLGLYAVYFLAGFLALFLSVGSISSEIDSGALHAVVAHPIRRAELIIGRWLAYVALIAAYVFMVGGSLLAISGAVAGYEASDAAVALGLMTLSAVGLLSVSLLGSSMLTTLANGVVVFSLFGLAWLAGIIEFIGNFMTNQSMVNLGIVVSLLVPSDAAWRGASFYAQSSAFLTLASFRADIPFLASAPPSAAFVVWAGLYPLVCVLGAIVAFERRDL